MDVTLFDIWIESIITIIFTPQLLRVCTRLLRNSSVKSVLQEYTFLSVSLSLWLKGYESYFLWICPNNKFPTLIDLSSYISYLYLIKNFYIFCCLFVCFPFVLHFAIEGRVLELMALWRQWLNNSIHFFTSLFLHSCILALLHHFAPAQLR